MNNVREFLRDVLTLRSVWVHQGQGRWVERRQMHPVLRGVILVGVLTIGLAFGVDYFIGNYTVTARPAPAEAKTPPRTDASFTPSSASALGLQPELEPKIDPEIEGSALRPRMLETTSAGKVEVWVTEADEVDPEPEEFQEVSVPWSDPQPAPNSTNQRKRG